MRPHPRTLAAGLLAAGFALSIAIPALAASMAPGQPDAQQAPITARVPDRHLSYGQAVVVSGVVPEGGRPVTLEFRSNGGAWKPVATTAAAPDGRYRLRATLRRSGFVRVMLGEPVSPGGAQARFVSAGGGTPASAERPITVAAAMRATTKRLDVLAGRRAIVSGVLAPGLAGRRVTLQVRGDRGWTTVARGRTASGGRFRVAYVPKNLGSRLARVRFGGDADNTAASRTLGRLDAYRATLASWYGLTGRTACGSNLTSGTLGVAHRTLPCGTMVTFRYNGRSVRVPVIDRGPFVGGREWDLTGATARALGFGGVGTVWSTR